MTTTQPTTVTKVDAADLSAMVREVNRSLMVKFINADLLNRAHLDVRTSVVLYDADMLFEYAVPDVLDDALLKRLFDGTPIRHYSVGV